MEGTHEVIISKDVFDHVQRQIASRRRQWRDGMTQIFAGLVKCADCGRARHFARQSKENHSGYYFCGTYSKKVDECTMHFINYNTLYSREWEAPPTDASPIPGLHCQIPG